MAPEMTLADSIEHGFKLLKGWRFVDLNTQQMRTLYIYLLWKDGASEEIAVDTGKHSDTDFIIHQLYTTFGYNETVVL
jgi:hypothetical protein